MFKCLTKWSSVINSIYSGQELFSYNWFAFQPIFGIYIGDFLYKWNSKELNENAQV